METIHKVAFTALTLCIALAPLQAHPQSNVAVAGGVQSTNDQDEHPATCAPVEVTPAAPKVWSANVAIGYSKTGGNTATESLTPAVNIQREKDGGKWLLGLKGAYGRYHKTTTQNIGMGALVYREDFDQSAVKFGDGRFYWGAGVLGFYDHIAGIEHRAEGIAGLGVHALKGPIVTSDFELAPGYRNERDSGEDAHEYGIWRAANYSGVEFTKSISFNMDTDLSTSLTENDNWILAVEPGLQFIVDKAILIKFGGWWRKQNEPVVGAKEEDWVWGTQIGVQF